MSALFSTPFMAGLFGLGGPEMVLIMAVVLLLFGGKRLPELASGLGKSIREFKKASQQIEDEMERSLNAPAPRRHAVGESAVVGTSAPAAGVAEKPSDSTKGA